MKILALSFKLIMWNNLKGISMKRFLILSAMLVSMPIFAMSAIASCPLDGGACTASNWDSTPLQEKYLPNRLQDLQRTDAFKPDYFKPYEDALINTETGFSAPANDYNSNCQFGVCLPGQQPGGDIIE